VTGLSTVLLEVKTPVFAGDETKVAKGSVDAQYPFSVAVVRFDGTGVVAHDKRALKDNTRTFEIRQFPASSAANGSSFPRFPKELIEGSVFMKV
jgi:hypothetical protein